MGFCTAVKIEYERREGRVHGELGRRKTASSAISMSVQDTRGSGIIRTQGLR